MSKKFDVVVIGGGPGGYVAAIRASQLGLSVACIEKREFLGGTCLNVGCIPSKSLLQSSEMYYKMVHEGKLHGIEGNLSLKFDVMQSRKEKVVSSLQQGVNFLFEKNKITRINGSGKLLTPNSVEVSSKDSKETLEASHIIIATGSETISLPFLPIDEKKVLSSTGALALAGIPKTMVVIGAGVIGVELGSVYSRLGTKVTFVEYFDRICPTMDETISHELQKILVKQGMTFHLSAKVKNANISPSSVQLEIEGAPSIEAEVLLVSIGRKPYTDSLGIENIGLKTNPKGFLEVDGMFRTKIPTVYAIGDVIEGPMLAHKASEEGIAVAEIIAGQRAHIDYTAIPSVIYTNPEVAYVGFLEKEIKAMNLPYQVVTFPYRGIARAKCMGEEDGLLKMISHTPSDRIIGVHIVGSHASELIACAAIAIEKKLTVSDLYHVPFAHPTLSEIFKEAALALHKRAIHR